MEVKKKDHRYALYERPILLEFVLNVFGIWHIFITLHFDFEFAFCTLLDNALCGKITYWYTSLL